MRKQSNRIIKNERLRSVVNQIKRNGYKVMTRGFPTLLAVKESTEEGKPAEIVMVWLRHKRKKFKKGDPLSGISRNQRFQIKHYQQLGLRVLIL